jgi:hypothetical protein
VVKRCWIFHYFRGGAGRRGGGHINDQFEIIGIGHWLAPNAIIDLDSHLKSSKSLFGPFWGASLNYVAHLTCPHLIRKVDVPRGWDWPTRCTRPIDPVSPSWQLRSEQKSRWDLGKHLSWAGLGDYSVTVEKRRKNKSLRRLRDSNSRGETPCT